jgi:hypothetical protein
MGCDYYIEKCLYICYKDKSKDYISLSIDRGYFYFSDLDEDEYESDEFKIKYNELVKLQLEPKRKPLIIYQDDKFLTNFLEIKYKPMVERNLQNGKYFGDIEKIIKKESRYERD